MRWLTLPKIEEGKAGSRGAEESRAEKWGGGRLEERERYGLHTQKYGGAQRYQRRRLAAPFDSELKLFVCVRVCVQASRGNDQKSPYRLILAFGG